MNIIVSWVPALLGAFVVLQTGLNRKFAAQWGLPVAVAMNALVLSLCAFAYLATTVYRSGSWSQYLENHALKTHAMETHATNFTFSPWFVVPGALGFLLVLGGPWSVARWGATTTFLLFVGAQLLASLLWDATAEGKSISLVRLLGIAVAWLGVFITTRMK